MDTLSAKLHRSFTHDYHASYIYMITVSVVNRGPILSKVVGSIEQPMVELTKVGKVVKREIFYIEKRYPQIKVVFNIIMPDHVHLILRVVERLPEKLSMGNIVAAWKQACGKAYSDMVSSDMKVAHIDELYKPIGQDFYSCAEGCLLQLASLPYHSDNRNITREQCQQLNEMVEMIVNTKCESNE